jgi:hypothetical protein
MMIDVLKPMSASGQLRVSLVGADSGLRRRP